VAIVSDKLEPNSFAAICTKCMPVTPLYFPTVEARNLWSTRHRTTGHEVIDADGPKV
jgi:hypothetical protein